MASINLFRHAERVLFTARSAFVDGYFQQADNQSNRAAASPPESAHLSRSSREDRTVYFPTIPAR